MFQKIGLSTAAINNYLMDKDMCFVKKAHMLCAPTYAMAGLASAYYNLNGKTIDVIPNPVDTSIFYPSTAACNSNTLGICFSGRFSREKGADVIIETIPSLMKDFKNLFFSIAGSDSIDDQGYSKITHLKKTLTEYGCIDRFNWTPAICYTKMPDFYRRHSILFSPTMFESFGNTLAEAQACGLPVISSRVGGVPEVVQDKATGFLENVSDSISFSARLRELITDKSLRDKMGKDAALRSNELFCIPSISSRYIKLIS